MRITAYVPCHNGEATLPEVLLALRGQSRPADQYLLIDDRSTDRSVAIAQQFGFEVYRTGPTHFGLAAGRNVALANARGELLVGCDADALPEPDFLAQVEHVFTVRPELVGLCGRLTEKHQDTAPDRWRALHLRQHYGDAEQVDPPILYGCSACHRTACVRQLGGWNPQFQASYEDCDLTLRLRRAGGRTLYAPSCRVWHLKRDTLDSVLKTFWVWHFPAAALRGCYAALDRWRPRLDWIWQDYRWRRLQDAATPQLALITCLLPWSLLVRDLHQLFSRQGSATDLQELGLLAQRVLAQCGANPDVTHWVGNWLRALAAGLPALVGRIQPWERGLLEEIEMAALSSIPDGQYWNRVQLR